MEVSNTKLSPNILKLNGTLQNNPYIKEDIKSNIKKHFKLSENENTAHQNWKFIPLNTYVTYIRKKESSEINYLSFTFKKLE